MLFNDGMVCPVCEAGKIIRKEKDFDFEYKGNVTIINKVSVFECPVCSESFIDPAREREIERTLTNERRKIDGLLTSDEIKKIRLSFNKTQEELAGILGVALKTFARYESGQVTQSRAMDNLLRLLKRNPDNMREFDPNWKAPDMGKNTAILQSRKKKLQEKHIS